MTRAEFIAQLRRALSGLAPAEVDEIIADYNAHFDEAMAAGRPEQDVAKALGDPARLARELRAESGLRRWETHRTPGALLGAIVGLGGMLALDVIIVLPVLCVLGIVAFGLGVALFVLAIVGLGMLLSSLLHIFSLAAVGTRIVTGLGLLGAGVGFGALLWLVLEGLVRLLGSYARLHYRVLKPAQQSA